VIKADLNIHALGWRYQGLKLEQLRALVLTEDDKAAVRRVVDWCAGVRKLDAIAITDYDLIQPSLYAMRYAGEHYPGLEVVPGVECDVHDDQVAGGVVRILCYWLHGLPNYTRDTPAELLLERIHLSEGFATLGRPLHADDRWRALCHLADGYEWPCEEEPAPDTLYRAIPQHNSGFHYAGVLPKADDPALLYNQFRLHKVIANFQINWRRPLWQKEWEDAHKVKRPRSRHFFD